MATMELCNLCEAGNLDAVKERIKGGYTIGRGSNPLYYAIEGGHIDVLEYLLAEPSLTSLDLLGPFLHAVRKNPKLALYLLDEYSRIDVTSSDYFDKEEDKSLALESAVHAYIENDPNHMIDTMYASYIQDDRCSSDPERRKMEYDTYDVEKFEYAKTVLDRILDKIIENPDITISSSQFEDLVYSDVPEVVLRLLRAKKTTPTLKAFHNLADLYGKDPAETESEGTVGEIVKELLTYPHISEVVSI